MRIEYRFTCGLRNGLHARPASVMAEVARRFSAKMTVGKLGGAAVDVRSVLSIVGLDVKSGEECIVVAEGEDAAAAVAGMRELIETRLEEGEELPPAAAQEAEPAGYVKLPMGLRNVGVVYAPGRAVSSGVGVGAAVLVEGLSLPREAREARAVSRDAELEAARREVAAVRLELRERAGAESGMEAELLRAHAEIADDPALWAELQGGIGGGATAAQAVVAAAERFSEKLRAAGSAYIRDRVVDIQDVCMQILDRLLGGRLKSMHVSLERPSVVFAETLTANQLLGLDRKMLRGLVLGRIGATSHTVILARSHRIPTIIDVANTSGIVKAGDPVVVDGESGCVLLATRPEVARYYEREGRTRARWRDRVEPMAKRAAVTSDGVRIEVGANASTGEEVTGAVENGAEGVGLLRTELLFLDREAAPTEQEQFEAYLAVVNAAAGRPVIIRTFDIGGDKPAAYLCMPREENPFLGVRGLRLYERHPGLLRTQLRAIVRASGVGPVKVMAPMVATPDEAAWFREEVRAVQAELSALGVSIDAAMPIGIMVEIPAAAWVMDQLCDEVDFFSIGTNDLCQYWMAVDRGNAAVSKLYNARQPSFLRLLRTIVTTAKERGKWIGVCGEMAGDIRNLPLMVGLGVDELSVAPGEVLAIKSAIAGADAVKCLEVLAAAMECKRVADVEAMLPKASWRAARVASILDVDLIEVGSDAVSKEEAIKEAVDLLFIAGRTDQASAVEEAVWAREATYSTGLGYGFAVPHCKTDAVSGPALAVIKLKNPVEWGSLDGLPVQVVMLLAVPMSDAAGGGGIGHMKVFAKLARKLMHEEFRERILAAADREAIGVCLRQELEIE